MVSFTLVGLSSSTSVFTWGRFLEGAMPLAGTVQARAGLARRSRLLRAKSRTVTACSPATGDDHGNSATSRWNLHEHYSVVPGTWQPSVGSHPTLPVV